MSVPRLWVWKHRLSTALFSCLFVLLNLWLCIPSLGMDVWNHTVWFWPCWSRVQLNIVHCYRAEFWRCFCLKQQYLFIRQILYKFCSNKAFKNPYILKKKKNAMGNNACMAVLNTAIYFKLNFTLLIRPHNLGKKVNHNSKNWCCHATVLCNQTFSLEN